MINNTNYIFLNTYLKYDVFDVPDAPLSQNSEAKILFVATDVSTYAQFTDTIEKIIQALELDIERDVVIHLVQPNDKFNIPAIHATYGCRYYLLFGNLA
ncbi:MAG: hypothetical protein KA974_00085 [Saprospiraceae bacterium]|nr:hypothetical protein [Saprospiraceae bacterium]